MHADGPVVIALDGSLHSAQTLRWGMRAASRRDASVILARAARDPRELVVAGWYPILDPDLDADAEAQGYLADQVERERAQHPDLTIDSRVLHGPEVPELRRLSGEAQLLVVGASGRAGRGRIGSVSGHLAVHARCPVAVVRDEAVDGPTAAGSGDAPADPHRPVVVGVDGSPTSLVAAQVAASEAALLDAPLVVLHAHPTIADPYGRGMPNTAAFVDDAATDPTDPRHVAARTAADRLRADHPGLEVRVALVDDDPVHALVTVSRGAQLVVVGSRGLGAFRGMLLGAVSNEVVREAACTVLVMHGAEASRESDAPPDAGAARADD